MQNKTRNRSLFLFALFSSPTNCDLFADFTTIEWQPVTLSQFLMDNIDGESQPDLGFILNVRTAAAVKHRNKNFRPGPLQQMTFLMPGRPASRSLLERCALGAWPVVKPAAMSPCAAPNLLPSPFYHYAHRERT